MKRKAKTKRSKRTYFKAEDTYVIADLAVVVIGISMFLFGSLSYFNVLTEKYVLSAAISSFLFVLAEFIIISEKVSDKTLRFHAFLFSMGIIVLIFLPAALEASAALEAAPNLLAVTSPSADMLTFFSLGFVLMLFGIKSIDTKTKIREEERKMKLEEATEKEELKKRIEDLEDELKKYK